MKQVNELTFPNGHQAKTTRIGRGSDVLKSLEHLGLHSPTSTLVLVGGASGISSKAMDQLRSLFSDTLAPLAEHLGLTVIDGGTDSGVMQLMGQARQKIQGKFPLLGVVAHVMVAFPNQPAPPESAPLEPHHTHFILVPGALWGDEAPWIAKVATVLSGTRPSLTVLVNGGMIAWQDVDNSLRENRPVLVMGGSGRTADILAAALSGDRSNDRANRLIESGLMEAIDLSAPPETLQQIFEAHLNPVMPLS